MPDQDNFTVEAYGTVTPPPEQPPEDPSDEDDQEDE